MGFENSVGVALGGIHVRHTCGGDFMMYNKGATCLGQRCMHVVLIRSKLSMKFQSFVQMVLQKAKNSSNG